MKQLVIVLICLLMLTLPAYAEGVDQDMLAEAQVLYDSATIHISSGEDLYDCLPTLQDGDVITLDMDISLDADYTLATEKDVAIIRANRSYGVNIKGSNVILSGFTFRSDLAGEQFLMIAAGNKDVLIENCTFIGNNDYYCTLVNIFSGRVTFRNCTFYKGLLPPVVIYDGAEVEMEGCTFVENCNSQYDGGAICNHGTLTVSNASFTDGAAKRGGGIFNDGTLTLENCTFSNNIGGDIYSSGMISIIDSAENYGFYTETGEKMSLPITDCTDTVALLYLSDDEAEQRFTSPAPSEDDGNDTDLEGGGNNGDENQNPAPSNDETDNNGDDNPPPEGESNGAVESEPLIDTDDEKTDSQEDSNSDSAAPPDAPIDQTDTGEVDSSENLEENSEKSDEIETIVQEEESIPEPGQLPKEEEKPIDNQSSTEEAEVEDTPTEKSDMPPASPPTPGKSSPAPRDYPSAERSRHNDDSPAPNVEAKDISPITLACGDIQIDPTKRIELQGYGDGYSHDTDPLTRAQMAVAIYRLLTDQSIAACDYDGFGFKDVSTDDWSYKEICIIKNAGIMIGTSNSSFSPNENVSWGQALTVLSRFFEPQSCALHKINYSGWALPAIENAVARGWIEDRADFSPDNEISRGDFTALFNSILESDL